MRKQWEEFLEKNGNESLAQLVDRLDGALKKGDIATAQDCLVSLWLKHDIAFDSNYNLIFVEDMKTRR